MATHSAAFGRASLPAQTPADDRRREPRFGAEGEVTVVVNEGPHQQELVAKLLDFSLRGLRVQMEQELRQGEEVRVFFSWGEVTTLVMWTSALPIGFEIGLQLF
jgi:PilZ domain